jgi:predicted peptidase
MKIFVKSVLCSLLLLAAQSLWGQTPSQELLRREVKLSAETYGYRVYVPQNRNPKKKLPVMLFLHGNGVNGTDNERHIRGINEIVYKYPQFFNFIIVFPQARPNTFWVGNMTDQALKALDQTVQEFNGDSNRLYLSGFSMGGYGTWSTAAVYPNKFAALIPIAGGIVPPFQIPAFLKKSFPSAIAEIIDAPDPYNALAKRIGKTSVWMTHGSADESVPVSESRKISQALKQNGNKNVFYTEYENTNHNDVIFKAFSEPKFYQWLANQKLKKNN